MNFKMNDLVFKEFKFDKLEYDEQKYKNYTNMYIAMFKENNCGLNGINISYFTKLIDMLTDNKLHPLTILSKHLEQADIKLDGIELIGRVFDLFGMFGALFGIDRIYLKRNYLNLVYEEKFLGYTCVNCGVEKHEKGKKCYGPMVVIVLYIIFHSRYTKDKYSMHFNFFIQWFRAIQQMHNGVPLYKYIIADFVEKFDFENSMVMSKAFELKFINF
ncbi:uncharacterized protein KGF55_001985 [Candida pseudojiufengensis]|uniref:uncharacterized protein n=1 Tax=Candida pseudojiufengensis TaxID=497109 RepID=UPI002224E39E|nr:uncharacterized protein KGF55_001985 [Candida pseudojiufengensis]KAI5964043.1 hypothetical protein KGF55_001985 [Candida pseudojiufengensis]